MLLRKVFINAADKCSSKLYQCKCACAFVWVCVCGCVCTLKRRLDSRRLDFVTYAISCVPADVSCDASLTRQGVLYQQTSCHRPVCACMCACVACVCARAPCCCTAFHRVCVSRIFTVCLHLSDCIHVHPFTANIHYKAKHVCVISVCTCLHLH